MIIGDNLMHEYFMREAIKEAEKSFLLDEVPVGALVVKDGIIISRGHNLRETLTDALAHAELLAIQGACKRLNSWRLLDCDLYVTMEPCVMCAGAMVNSRIKRVIYGASDYRFGACGSIFNIANSESLNHRIEIVSGVLEEDCKKLLQDFFKAKRKK